MTKIIVNSPKGNISLELGSKEEYTTEALLKFVAKIFNYTGILSGVDPGRLVDSATDVALHPKAKVPAGEYSILLA